MKTVGVLALQGDFEAHGRMLNALGVAWKEVRTSQELASCDGLIIPGGESTTMLKLLDLEELTEPVRSFGHSKPIYGTCAGAILLAKVVTHPAQASFGLMDIEVERNGYGRQIDSRAVRLTTEEGATCEAVFIRAPIIRRAGKAVRVLASYQDTPVWVEDSLHMATTFHPELTHDLTIHRRFCEKL